MKMKALLRKILVMGIAALFLGVVGSAFFKVDVNVKAVGATIYVDDDNTTGPWDGTEDHPCQNITSGLEYASNGDMVFVFAGTYNENVVVNKSVTLKGDSKPVINGSSLWGTIFVDVTSYPHNFAYGVTIDGFEVLWSYHGVGSGIYVDVSGIENVNDASVNIGDIMVANNTVNSNSTGIFAYVGQVGYDMYGNSSVIIGDFRISNNVINSAGNGIEVEFTDLGRDMYNTSTFMMGDISINNNLLSNMGVDCWFSYWGYNLHQDSSFVMGSIDINGNTVNNGNYGVNIGHLGEFGCELHDHSSFTMGHILVNDNNIDSNNEGIDVYDLVDLGMYLYDDSIFTMGDIQFNDNTINSSGYGLYIEYMQNFGCEMEDISSFAMGHIELSGNIINSGNDGIHVDHIDNFGSYMEENSTFTMGNIEFSGNIINSTYYGICTIDLAYQFGHHMTGHSSFTMGHIRVNENVINNEGGSTGYNNAGIYVEYIEYLGNCMYNMSTFVMGNIEVSDNRINSTTYGIYLYEIDYFGYQMYDDSIFAMGEILVNDNIINSTGDGMYLEYIEYFGQIMYGNSSFTMSNVQISGNVVNSAQRGIFIEDLYEFGSYMYDTSSFTMSNIEISGNVVNSIFEGMYIQSLYHAYYMYNNASFAIEDVLVNDNIINSKDSGIVLRQIWHHTRFGYNAIDNTTIITGNVEFCQNEIVATNSGLDLADLENATIRNNMMQNCSLGIYLQDSASNFIYHNNFINNTLQAYVRALYTPTAYCNNTWDNGYPSGGNYWSEYTDVDNNSGPYQNITGNPDGIWDNPYIINENNTDRYPFANLYDDTPPTIGIPSRTPSGDILSNQEVTVMVNVTDNLTGVKNVTLYYTIDDGLHWNSTEMLRDPSTELYEAIIPGQEYGKTVRFKIEAFDYAGNNQTMDGVEAHCIYQIVPEFPSLTILLAFTMTTLLLAIVFKKKRTPSTRNKIQLPFFCLTEY